VVAYTQENEARLADVLHDRGRDWIISRNVVARDAELRLKIDATEGTTTLKSQRESAQAAGRLVLENPFFGCTS
jgi:hypothetical protein